MKRYFSLIIVLSLLFCMCACGETNTDIQAPVHFYYHTIVNDTDISNSDGFDSTIAAEIREGADYTADELLALYVSGPQSTGLFNPFPDDLTIISTELQGSRLCITLSTEFSQLGGIDLTLACSCLASTAFELYGCSSVEIIANRAQLDGKTSIIVDKEDIILIDDSYVSQSE